MDLGAGRDCGSGAATASAGTAAIKPDAAIPAAWTNSRLFVFLAMIAPQKHVVIALNRHSPGAPWLERNIAIF
jgi:hypothetical protein